MDALLHRNHSHQDRNVSAQEKIEQLSIDLCERTKCVLKVEKVDLNQETPASYRIELCIRSLSGKHSKRRASYMKDNSPKDVI